jgi:tetraacyldisaccharide 4'-kinase
MASLTWINKWFSPVLRLTAGLYGLGVRFRIWLYRRQVLKARDLPLKVISIGNLVVGGTGKTPHTALLAAYLQKQGIKVAVLSRGYRGTKMKTGAVISNGQSLSATVEEGGEEPFWLAQKLPGIPVVIGRDRYRSGLLCHHSWKTQWAILDDGYQHLALKREINILLWPAHHPPDSERLMPLGRLREPLREMERADLILISHGERIEPPRRETLKKEIQAQVPAKPVFFSEHKPVTLWRYPDKSAFSLSWLAGKRLVAFCGLAEPQSLIFSLKQLGADPLKLVEFPDHHFYRENDKQSLEILSRSLKTHLLVTTEKDAIKLGEWNTNDLQILVLGIEVQIDNPTFWEWLDQKTGLRHEA